jgi:hypothetical protein
VAASRLRLLAAIIAARGSRDRSALDVLLGVDELPEGWRRRRDSRHRLGFGGEAGAHARPADRQHGSSWRCAEAVRRLARRLGDFSRIELSPILPARHPSPGWDRRPGTGTPLGSRNPQPLWICPPRDDYAATSTGSATSVASRALKTVSAVSSFAFGPIRPMRQIDGASGPSPPPISIPWSRTMAF